MTARIGLALVLSFSLVNLAHAQSSMSGRSLNSSRTLPGSVGGSGSGTQIGPATQLQQQAFVGSSRSNISPIRSMQGANSGGMNGGFNSGLGGLGGLGMGGGLGGFGMGGGLGGYGLGGLGGMGMGGFGGYGMGMGGMGMGGMGMNRGGRMGMGNYGNQFGNNQVTGRSIKAQIKLGFTPPVVASTVVARRFEQRLTRIPRVKDAGRVTVKMDGGTAILEGVVATEHDRELIGRLATLEPGVDSVQNQLAIDPTAASLPDTP